MNMQQKVDPTSSISAIADIEGRLSAEDYLKHVNNQIDEFDSSSDNHKPTAHWRDENPTTFTASQRAHTTVLHAGLTMAHDLFIQSAFRGLGYKVEAMDVPDTHSLQYGREFGNRGQCNPTYFTVGNLVKKLKEMEASGIAKKDIISNYLFATAGSCGPCRFGTYVTEYRKALRDAGFEGFRVVLFQQSGGAKQATGEDLGLKIDGKFFLTFGKAVIIGDILNALMYRIRPYELEKGATDAVIARAKQRVAKAFETRQGLWKALWQTRKEIAQIKVDKSQIKPRVAIIGEFWAMTTEGDGNYKMQRFLEQEGAEVEIQLVTNWILYLFWSSKYDTLERLKLKGFDKNLNHDTKGSKFALEGVSIRKRLWGLKIVELYVRGLFWTASRVAGLKNYHLPDMDHIAEISHSFYDNNLRGGEGHMEVGKLIHNVVDNTMSMTLSIKPFGCMPSSAVSDGVQSLITELYPQAIFLPIETNGDGAVNVYSRVQMQLFKARQAAEKEVLGILDKANLTIAQFQQQLRASHINSPLHRSPHGGACSAADAAGEIIETQKPFVTRMTNKIKKSLDFTNPQKQTLQSVERAAKAFKNRHNNLRENGVLESVVKIVEPA
jgi:predicted nucleotide-binding protein (sugar kinase/HSP70/actin superfamily)